MLSFFGAFAKLSDSGKAAALDLESQFFFHCYPLSLSFNNQYGLELMDLV
jgi:hypothetical protein